MLGVDLGTWSDTKAKNEAIDTTARQILLNRVCGRLTALLPMFFQRRKNEFLVRWRDATTLHHMQYTKVCRSGIRGT
jgi:hypothetical protein